jgi:carboxyl-terminal processing protease
MQVECQKQNQKLLPVKMAYCCYNIDTVISLIYKVPEMKNIILLIIVFIFASCNGPYAESINPNKDKVFVNKHYACNEKIVEFTELGRQYYFIKIWGFLKYYGEPVDADTNWDEYFINNISTVKGLNPQLYQLFIANTISLFKLPELKKVKNNVANYSLLDNRWFNDGIYFSETVSGKLNYIFENHTSNSNQFISQSRIGNLEFNDEQRYDKAEYPNMATRLLGLARYWNIINFFYVYKNDSSENWDRILMTNIPKFTLAHNAKEYHITVHALSSKLYDCHSMVRSDLLDKDVFGQFVPNFRVKLIDSTLMVSRIRIDEWDTKQIMVGDILLKINNEDALTRYRYYNSFMKGANALSEQRIICPYLFGSVSDKMKLLILRHGKQIEVNLNLKKYPLYTAKEQTIKKELSSTIVIKKFDTTTAYINLENISGDNFESNFTKAKKYKNLIIDLRNYPQDKISLKLTDFLLPKPVAFFTSTYADVTSPGLLRSKKGYMLGSENGDKYKGNVYILVSEATQSQAEFLVMALQTSKKVTVVGSQTAGSDGNVTQFHFPGKIETMFTGIGIYYPDFTPTQRKGVKIDVRVDYTLKAIAAGKDEILEKALNVITNAK